MTTPTNELTAEQAKAISVNAVEKRFASALKEIKQAAEDGYSSCILTRGCSAQLESKLKALGYNCARVGNPESIRVNW